jgi:protein-tyrosine kinase
MSKIMKALEKAKEERSVVKPASASGVNGARPECAGISIQYCRTKVVNVHPAVLKKNKILSSFHGNGMADRIKILRTQVLDRMKEIGGNRLLVTSANQSEGKTLVALNLAVSIAQVLDRTVLLVETDMRTSSLHRYLGMEVKKGLGDYLLGEAEIPDILINPGIERLVILPSGKTLATSAELLGAPRMESLVKEMKERYADRFIIFDGSSLLSFADPLIFSRLIDGILLVVRAEKTPKDDVRRCLELLKDKPLIGTVFNMTKG